jgi:hypothetical protein
MAVCDYKNSPQKAQKEKSFNHGDTESMEYSTVFLDKGGTSLREFLVIIKFHHKRHKR